MKKLVYICSPLRGDILKNLTAAAGYCREVVETWPEVIPIAPHLYFTQFLNDNKPRERSLGMEMGLELLDMCEELWVYGIDNPSEGMKAELEYAKSHGITIRDGFALRKEASTLWEKKIGDALLYLPIKSDNYGDAEIIKSTIVRISGELVLEMAKELTRNRGQDIEAHVGAAL